MKGKPVAAMRGGGGGSHMHVLYEGLVGGVPNSVFNKKNALNSIRYSVLYKVKYHRNSINYYFST